MPRRANKQQQPKKPRGPQRPRPKGVNAPKVRNIAKAVVKSALGNSLEGIGHRIGSNFGPVGGAVGSLADHVFGKILGRGAYVETGADISGLDANSLVKPMSSNAIPAMHIDTEGAVRISKREFIGDILIATAFAVTPLRIEPIILPWLAQVATAWEKWIALGVVLEYVPTSGYAVASTSAALGTVSMCAVSDVGQVTNIFPTTKVDVLTYGNSVSSSPAAPFCLPIECATDQQQIPVKYVRDGGATGATFLPEQVVQQQVQIVTGGSQNAVAVRCGELWITYDIMFLEPRKFNGPAPMLEDTSLKVREYLKLVSEYNTEIGDQHLTSFSPTEFLDANCRAQTIAARLRSPEMVSARFEYASQREKLHVTHLNDRAQSDLSSFVDITEPETIIAPRLATRR